MKEEKIVFLTPDSNFLIGIDKFSRIKFERAGKEGIASHLPTISVPLGRFWAGFVFENSLRKM